MSACAALVGAALFECLAANPACLPPTRTPLVPIIRGVVLQESRANPWALRDETTRESLFFTTRADAEAAARQRHARGHTLGLGWMQITHTANWVRHWGSVERALTVGFEPCANLLAGSNHLAADITAALSRYNSGTFQGALSYAAGVLRRASSSVPVPTATTNCPDAPPEWDAWATARHTHRCDRISGSAPSTHNPGASE